MPTDTERDVEVPSGTPQEDLGRGQRGSNVAHTRVSLITERIRQGLKNYREDLAGAKAFVADPPPIKHLVNELRNPTVLADSGLLRFFKRVYLVPALVLVGLLYFYAWAFAEPHRAIPIGAVGVLLYNVWS